MDNSTAGTRTGGPGEPVLSIGEYVMRSTGTAHVAGRLSDTAVWVVSWLPRRVLSRNEAISAMTLAETVATRDLQSDRGARLLVESLAEELGLGFAEAVRAVAKVPPVVDEVAEEVELVRADDLAVVEVVRAAGAVPVVRLSAEDRVHTWTVREAFAAAAVLVDLAEAELDKVEADDEEPLGMVDGILDVVGALITAGRMARDEMKAAAR